MEGEGLASSSSNILHCSVSSSLELIQEQVTAEEAGERAEGEGEREGEGSEEVDRGAEEVDDDQKRTVVPAESADSETSVVTPELEHEGIMRESVDY